MKKSKTTPKTRSWNESKIRRLYTSLVTEFSSKKWGYAILGLLAQSCIGSIAVMQILKNYESEKLMLSELFMVTAFCMTFNAAVLIDLKPIPTFNILIASLFVSISMIIINLI